MNLARRCATFENRILMLELDSKTLRTDHQETVARIDQKLAQCITIDKSFALAKNLVTDCARSMCDLDKLKGSAYQPSVQ